MCLNVRSRCLEPSPCPTCKGGLTLFSTALRTVLPLMNVEIYQSHAYTVKASLIYTGRLLLFKINMLGIIFLKLNKSNLKVLPEHYFHLVHTASKEWSLLIRQTEQFHSPRVQLVRDRANRRVRLGQKFLLKKSSTSPD